MRPLLSILCAFLLCGSPLAQNLVPNPSFEQVTSCPTFASQLDKAAPWYNPTMGTPELYHGCAPLSAYVSVPTNTTGGFQYARTGQGYAGLFAWRSDIANVREYAEVQLLSPLQAGSCYLMTMYVNMPDDHAFACDGFGAYFSVGPIGANNGQVLPYAAHVQNPSGALITDTVGWTEITGVYSASGGETHLTIGNFRNDATTQSLLISNNVWYTISAYLLVDDVSVVEIPLEVDLGPDTLLCSDDGLLLDATLPGATYLWSTGSTSPTLAVTGPGTYWVTVSTGACSASDTIVVSGHGLPVFDLPEELSLCPGASAVLDATVPGATVRWMDGDTNAVRTVDAPGTWSVEATNACGTSMATVEVRSDICPCVPYLPNAFTPNADGINDRVGPLFRCDQGTIAWTIHDRWGAQIFQGNGENDLWDGTISGVPAAEGVYVWRAHLIGSRGSGTEYNGHLVLVR